MLRDHSPTASLTRAKVLDINGVPISKILTTMPDGYYGNTSGDSINIVLPNSKLELAVQLIGYYLAIDGNKHSSRGIQPDHHIAETIDDILTGKDRAMELAESLAKK